MADPKNVFLTDLRGFANPVIAEKLRSAGARLIACDPAIASDGEENGIEVIAWGSPAIWSRKRPSVSAAVSMRS